MINDLVSKNLTELVFNFDPAALGGLPTQVGFVTTQAAFPTENVIIDVYNVFPAASQLNVPFAPNRFFGVTDTDGIQAIRISMARPFPDEPFFQLDHLQYVPEPSGAVLLAIGVAALLILGCRGHRDFRWLRAIAATLMMILVMREAVGITTTGGNRSHPVDQ